MLRKVSSMSRFVPTFGADQATTSELKDSGSKMCGQNSLVRVFVIVLFLLGLVLLWQIHILTSMLSDVTDQLIKLRPQNLDSTSKATLKEIMNLD